MIAGLKFGRRLCEAASAVVISDQIKSDNVCNANSISNNYKQVVLKNSADTSEKL